MSSINANDLKTKGVAAIAAMLERQSEAVIVVRGKERFVVMELARYTYLRECELSVALAETHADLAAGRFVKESPEQHLKRIGNTDALLEGMQAPAAKKGMRAAFDATPAALGRAAVKAARKR